VRRDLRFPLVLLCFFVSGFAALIYQTAWTRQFAFVFGTSELAIATVLASYMGGLAAGSAAATRWVGHVRRPVLAYGLLELGIALSALAVPWALRAATVLFVSLFRTGPGAGDTGESAHALFYLLSSFAILLVPTALMGATLPLLTRYAVHREEQIGPRVSALYAFNTFGAVLGTLCAGFVLLPALGLGATIRVAIGANALVFGAAVLAARGSAPAPPESAAEAGGARAAGRWILPLMFASGAASFSYEVLWSRLLGHLLGGSVYGFATMLASFLVGIALGATVASRFARNAARAARAFAVAQIGTAGLSTLTFLALDRMPDLSEAVARWTSDPLFADAAVAAATLLPGALCIGATFPLAVRILAQGEADAGPASARVYAWNTLGAIAGSVGSGFFLLPLLQYHGLVTLAVSVNAAIALLALAGGGVRRTRVAAAALAVAALGALLLPPQPPWRLLRSSAISGRARGAAVYFGVGRSATVILYQEGAGWRLRTNGLPEAVVLRRGSHVRGDSLAQWLGSAPSLARPEARSMLVIGFGGGVVVEAVPSLIESIDVVELEPEVIRANRSVSDRRRVDPLGDPRVHVILNDARGELQLSQKRYDIIASQPSHPWTGGASHLYTREFFQLARERLAPGGILAQWMSQAFVDEELLRALLASLLEVFPHVSVYQPTPGAMLLLASDRPLDMAGHSAEAIRRAPADFAALGVLAPEGAVATLVLDDEGARRFAAGSPLVSDDRNLMEMRSSSIARGVRPSLSGEEPFADLDPLLAPTPGIDRVAVVRRLLAPGFEARARRVAEATQDPVERDTALGVIAASAEKPGAAREALARALAADPKAPQARAARLRLERRALVKGELELASLLVEPSAEEQAVVAGWQAETASNWAAAQELDARLAAVAPGRSLYEDALRLRVVWRLGTRDPQRAREALELTDALIPASSSARDEVLRALANATAGDPEAALVTLAETGTNARRRSTGNRTVAREARQLALSLAGEKDAQAIEAAIRRRFP
jgi:spermidine synthase